MACVIDKGQLNESARNLLQTIETNALSAQDISKNSGIPLFKVRSSLREMKSMELVIEENEQFALHPNATNLIKKS